MTSPASGPGAVNACWHAPEMAVADPSSELRLSFAGIRWRVDSIRGSMLWDILVFSARLSRRFLMRDW
jgi:hypothetical protein